MKRHSFAGEGVFLDGRSRRIVLGRMLLMIAATVTYGPVDPGIRSGPPGAGQPLATGMSGGEMAFFTGIATAQFNETESVGGGLGPRFNLDSCGGCHAYPAPGGSSPPKNNPQVVHAGTMAPGNTAPAFLSANGRFVKCGSSGSRTGRRMGACTISTRSWGGATIRGASIYPNPTFRIPAT